MTENEVDIPPSSPPERGAFIAGEVVNESWREITAPDIDADGVRRAPPLAQILAG